jgi:Flp pilus assembly pilin Flp
MTMLWEEPLRVVFRIPNIGKGVKQMLKLFVALQSRYMDLRTREEGQAFTEYAVILAVIGIALAGVLLVFEGTLANVFTTISGKL